MAFSIKGQMKPDDDGSTPAPFSAKSRAGSAFRPAAGGQGVYKPAILDSIVFRDPHNTPSAPNSFANISERTSWMSDRYMNLDINKARETLGRQRGKNKPVVDRNKQFPVTPSSPSPDPHSPPGASTRPHPGSQWRTGDVVPFEPAPPRTPGSSVVWAGEGVPLDQPGIAGRGKDLVPTGRQGVPHWSEGGPLFPPGNPPLEPGRPQMGRVLQGEITFRRPAQQESRATQFQVDAVPDRLQLGPAPMRQIGPGRRPGSGNETPFAKTTLKPRSSFSPEQGAKKVPGGIQGTLFSAREATQGTLFRGRGPR